MSYPTNCPWCGAPLDRDAREPVCLVCDGPIAALPPVPAAA